MAEGIRVDPRSALGICENCQSDKQTRQSNHDPAQNKVKEILGRVFNDICEQITPPTFKDYKYMLLFIDETIEMTCAMSLKMKSSSEVLARFKEYKEHVELETEKKIKILRIDNEGEYKKFMKDYLKECGIKHEIIASYSSEQNGISKCANRTIIE